MALCLAGPISYCFLLDFPLLRSTGLPAIALAAAGGALGVAAAFVSRQRWVCFLAAAEVLIAGLFVAKLFLAFRLPPAAVVSPGKMAPDFTLSDAGGQPVSLSSYRGKGPVLLVFYRGFW